MRKQLGLFGGTFNPVHRYHVSMAEAFLTAFALDHLLVIPAGLAYHKKEGNEVTSATHRYQMCQLAFSSLPKTSVSTTDLERKGNTYTYDTLTILRHIYSEYQFLWLLGSDAFLQLNHWYRYQEVIMMTDFVVVVRPPAKKQDLFLFNQKLHPQANYYCLSLPACALSASSIRRSITQHCFDEKSVSLSVRDYIKEHHLYQI